MREAQLLQGAVDGIVGNRDAKLLMEFEPPAKTANKTAKPPKRRKVKVAAAEPASEQRVEAESKSSSVMTFKIPL